MGVGSIPRMEVALVSVMIAIKGGALTGELADIFLAATMIFVTVTTLITPPLLKWSFSLHGVMNMDKKGEVNGRKYLVFASPLGFIRIEEFKGHIVSLKFCGESVKTEGYTGHTLIKAKEEIMEYFSGKRKVFGIAIQPEGRDYQKKVWETVRKIPYGETRTYEWVAEIAGGSPRSAGNALNANPIPIIIPCHRVIRKDASIGGFSSGAEIKRFLLEHERKNYKTNQLLK